MEKYKDFQAIDFVQDDYFLKWVKNTGEDESIDEYWRDWLLRNPEKREIVEEAKRLILTVEKERQFIIPEQQQRLLWDRIDQSIDEIKTEELKEKKKRGPVWLSWYSVAATIALVSIAFAYLFQIATKDKTGDEDFTSLKTDLVQYRNDGQKANVLVLHDGSTVTLQPKSVLYYPESFSGDQREVHLSGEAFFNVVKDSQKPFFVKTNALTTQVLGTSFNVRAYKSEKNILVSVRSGKVSVFTNPEIKGTDKDHIASEGTVLLPNQQAIFERKEAHLFKSLVEEPVLLAPSVLKNDFQFTDAPIKEVFSLLEEAYGVDIVYEEETFSGCYLNASLSSVSSLYDKLRIICKAIKAEYQILDAHIIISGKGCST
jgi:ferric-dicitrate binding protein FerR (iron transport regulator)